MFKELESAAIWGLAAGAASSWASRQMQPDSQRPVWQGELNGVVLTVVETNHHGYLGYAVSVIADGWCWSVGRFPTYPQAVAVVQAGDLYLQRGGTVRAWLDYHWPGYAPAPLTPPRPALPRYQRPQR